MTLSQFVFSAGKEGVTGLPANADPNRPRPQSASDRSTPSQVYDHACQAYEPYPVVHT